MSDDIQNGNQGLAFGMVVGAGMCTSLGAALAFVVNLDNKYFLSVSLALSAGVMVYVSMVEIFVKALAAFSDEWCPDRVAGEVCPRAYGATTGLFFAGVVTCAFLNLLTSRQFLSKVCGYNGSADDDETKTNASNNSGTPLMEQTAPSVASSAQGPAPPMNFAFPMAGPQNAYAHPPVTFAVQPGAPYPVYAAGALPMMPPAPGAAVPGALGVVGHAFGLPDNHTQVLDNARDNAEKGVRDNVQSLADLPEDEKKNLGKTGLLTALAIAVHNFPEGLATYVAALAEPSLGAAIAVAIAIHNIPEGVCVAMPVFYSTGSRLKGFMWATLSGVSEPIGALFGYAVLGGDVSNVSYGLMFAIVAGMMVYISLAELLPTAYKHLNNPPLITCSLVAGMVIMALSLVAFQI